jgi:hypothetical protein
VERSEKPLFRTKEMLTIDTSKVEIRQINIEMKGLFARKDMAPGETIFIEDIIVFESTQRDNPSNIPDVVELALRIWADNHFDHLVELGFKSSVWTFPPTKEDKRCINQLLAKGAWRGSKALAFNCYKIAAGYNLNVSYHVINYPNPGEVTLSGRRLISLYACMVNHSCEPNAVAYPLTTVEEIKQKVQGLTASRAIKEGDEITFSYVTDVPDEMVAEIEDSSQKRAAQPIKNFKAKKRRALLKKLYGLNCSCAKCLRESRD